MFARLKTGRVRAKISLTGQLDGGQPKNYLKPCSVAIKAQAPLNKKLPVLRNMTASKKR